MRHPIDDIFKDGLSHQKHALKQEEWLKAKDMLDLEKRKRRFPIWWFGVAAGLVLGAIIIPMLYIDKGAISESDSVETITQDQDSKTTKTNQVANSKAITNEADIKKESAPIKSGTKYSNESSKIKEFVEIKNTSVFDRNNGIDNKTQNDIAKSQNANTNQGTGIESAVSGSRLSHEIIPESQSVHLTKDAGTIGLATVPNSTTSLVTGTGRSMPEPNFVIITYLSQAIKAFQISIDLPKIEDYKLTSNSENQTPIKPWSINLYASYAIPNSKPGIGLSLNRDISTRFSTSIGIGVNYISKNDAEFTGELEVVDANGFRQLSDVSETLSFRQYSLEIPVSIGYRFQRHSIMALAIAEFNLWSELTRNSTISNVDAISMDPLGPSISSNDPINLMQNARTVNEATLSKPKYYAGMGYGIDLSPKISFQINGLWKFSNSSNNESISNSLTSTQAGFINESNWFLRTSIALRF